MIMRATCHDEVCGTCSQEEGSLQEPYFIWKIEKHDFGIEKSDIFGREHKHQNFLGGD